MIVNFVSWISDLFCPKNDTTLIGLCRLKQVKEPVQQTVVKRKKDMTLSELMRGEY